MVTNVDAVFFHEEANWLASFNLEPFTIIWFGMADEFASYGDITVAAIHFTQIWTVHLFGLMRKYFHIFTVAMLDVIAKGDDLEVCPVGNFHKVLQKSVGVCAELLWLLYTERVECQENKTTPAHECVGLCVVENELGELLAVGHKPGGMAQFFRREVP